MACVTGQSPSLLSTTIFPRKIGSLSIGLPGNAAVRVLRRLLDIQSGARHADQCARPCVTQIRSIAGRVVPAIVARASAPLPARRRSSAPPANTTQNVRPAFTPDSVPTGFPVSILITATDFGSERYAIGQASHQSSAMISVGWRSAATTAAAVAFGSGFPVQKARCAWLPLHSSGSR